MRVDGAVAINRPSSVSETFTHPIEKIVAEFGFGEAATDDDKPRVKGSDEIGDPIAEDKTLLFEKLDGKGVAMFGEGS